MFYRNTDSLARQFCKVGDALLSKPIPNDDDTKAFCIFCLVSITLCCKGKCSSNTCIASTSEYLMKWIKKGKVVGGTMFGENSQFRKLKNECNVRYIVYNLYTPSYIINKN